MIDACRLTARRLLTGAVLAAVAASTTGCGGGDEDSLGGMGLPTLSSGDQVDGDVVAFEGVLRVDAQGCLMVGLSEPGGDGADRWVVWPAGAQEVYGDSAQAGNGALVEGRRYVRGAHLTGTGRLVALEALPGGGEGGGYFRSSGRYCNALEGGVLVIDGLRDG